jgi:hypothetical protein
MAGKTGADAVFLALSHICRVIGRYHTKLDVVIDAAAVAGAITSGQAATAHAFVDAAVATCAIFKAIAEYNSLTP